MPICTAKGAKRRTRSIGMSAPEDSFAGISYRMNGLRWWKVFEPLKIPASFPGTEGDRHAMLSKAKSYRV
jgi:hypothetical protein